MQFIIERGSRFHARDERGHVFTATGRVVCPTPEQVVIGAGGAAFEAFNERGEVVAVPVEWVTGLACGHSACRQNWIDSGELGCVHE